MISGANFLRLIELHERIKILKAEIDSGKAFDPRLFGAIIRECEREIAARVVREAQRERREWARERYGWQPRPCA